MRSNREQADFSSNLLLHILFKNLPPIVRDFSMNSNNSPETKVSEYYIALYSKCMPTSVSFVPILFLPRNFEISDVKTQLSLLI